MFLLDAHVSGGYDRSTRWGMMRQEAMEDARTPVGCSDCMLNRCKRAVFCAGGEACN